MSEQVKAEWAELRASFVEFWGAPSRGSAVALFRIAYGVLATWTAVFVLINLDRYYGYQGMVPWRHAAYFPEQRYSVLALAPDSPALLLGIGSAFLVGSLLLTVGLFPKLGALAIFVTNLALQHRNPYVLNGGDRLFLILSGLALFLPLGARWSIDAWRGRSAGPPQAGTVWSQRLVALQISYVYLYSCFAKLRHEGWRSGEAVGDVLASAVFAEWPARIEAAFLVKFLTWSTLALELLFPVLVWNRRFRPYVLAAGVAFHAGIEVAMTIPMFSAAMIVSYACFLGDDEAERLVRAPARLLAWAKARARAAGKRAGARAR